MDRCRGCARAEARPEGVYCWAYRQYRSRDCTAFYVPMRGHPRVYIVSAAADLLSSDIRQAYYKKETPQPEWIKARARFRTERAMICRGVPIAEQLVALYMAEALQRVSVIFPQLKF